MTDNVATLEGFTKAVTLDSDQCTIFALVRPDTDFDGLFKAWDTDEQEFIRVSGWLFTVAEGHE